MGMIKVEAVVNRERVETVVSTVEAEVGHVGVTVFEALGHGRQSGISYDDPELPPKAFLTFIVPEDKAQPVLEAICAGAKAVTSPATDLPGCHRSTTSGTTGPASRCRSTWR